MKSLKYFRCLKHEVQKRKHKFVKINENLFFFFFSLFLLLSWGVLLISSEGAEKGVHIQCIRKSKF